MTITRLAIRELWISFQLLLVLSAFVAAGALVALVPGAPAVTLDRLAAGLGIAAAIASASGAGALASQRQRGVGGWLVSRAVPRRTLLHGWFLALGLPVLIGTVAAAVLGWLAVAGAATGPDPLPFGLAVAAVGAGSLAGLALGLAMGAVLSPVPAALGALVVCGAVAVVSLALPSAAEFLPGAGHVALAALSDVGRPLALAVRAVGTSVLLIAVLLVLARAALDRADL